ncbi:hypothetical protein EGR_09359 [Echinococcus granulosus]|uniref:Uncharacterized protein n=1 Tax=Echinococcus granulosus TaxID=6210 RepID=W6U3V7_ECHGR|nr:hypothetical protein EGR_09359 [Echinococcus granulosus]EUB55793.1 hypothetical protein EGR_09359 [Echinococcus granulosus]
MVFSCDALIWPIFSVCYVIAMLSVFLSSFESFIVNDVHPLKFNSSPPLAKRVVFITIDGLGEHILRRTKHKYVKFLTWMVKCTLGLGRMMASAIFLLAVASVMEHGTVSPMYSYILKRVLNMFVKTKSLIETSFFNPFTIVFSSLSKLKVEHGIENYKHQSTFPSLFSDYNEEPNYREMITLNFGCIVCEFFLGDYATAGRRLLAKLFKSTGPQRRHILRLPLAILQAFLIVILSFEKRFSSSVCTFTRSILVHIQPSDRCCEGKFNSSESSHSHSKLKFFFMLHADSSIAVIPYKLICKCKKVKEVDLLGCQKSAIFGIKNDLKYGLIFFSDHEFWRYLKKNLNELHHQFSFAHFEINSPAIILTDCFIKSVESFLPIIIINLLALVCSIANSVLTLKFELWILKRMIIPYFQNSLRCKTDCYSYIKISIQIPFNNTMSFFPVNLLSNTTTYFNLTILLTLKFSVFTYR